MYIIIYICAIRPSVNCLNKRSCGSAPAMFYIFLVIGASLSEPHTSQLNDDFSYIYIYMSIRPSCKLQCT